MSQLVQLRDKFNGYLKAYWDSNYKRNYDNPLVEVVEYSLMSGGKRIRPLMAIVASQLYDDKRVYNAAIAIEMMHTYSLVHDDLPGMDNDDYRRGQYACHKKFGEGVAILAGNLLYNEAIKIFAELDNILALKATYANGLYGLIGGQVLDISETKNYSMEYIELIHRYKTGALMAFSFYVGGYIGKLPLERLKDLEDIGYNLGIAFQVVDDIFDYTSGKRDKYNIVDLVKSIDEARRIAKEYTEKTFITIDRLNIPYIRDIAEYVLNRDK